MLSSLNDLKIHYSTRLDYSKAGGGLICMSFFTFQYRLVDEVMVTEVFITVCMDCTYS